MITNVIGEDGIENPQMPFIILLIYDAGKDKLWKTQVYWSFPCILGKIEKNANEDAKQWQIFYFRLNMKTMRDCLADNHEIFFCFFPLSS